MLPQQQARLEQILAALNGKTGGIIAIDGRAASGKTTLAKALAVNLSAGLVHMDDFFLPLSLRTEERLAQPGGNVHYERFVDEILPHIGGDYEFSYWVFDCGTMDYGKIRKVAPSAWRVVEGAYSCHPVFGEYMTLRVFSDVEPEEQLRRILERDGEDKLAMFRDRWLPLEERYISCHHLPKPTPPPAHPPQPTHPEQSQSPLPTLHLDEPAYTYPC